MKPPGTVYMLTRRAERRVRQFRPDAEMNQIVLYCLAMAADRTNVALVATTLMSNHNHASSIGTVGSARRWRS